MEARGAPPKLHDPETLTEAWRELSLRMAWLRPGDWHCPEVDAVAEFVATGADADSALESLGWARAVGGVGLAETIGDLRCLADATGGLLDPWATAEAVARGWQDGAGTQVGPSAMLDPTTNLATLGYLMVRLREIYAAASAADTNAAETHCLLVADTAVMCDDPWLRLERGSLLGSVLSAVFASGETMVSLGAYSGAAIVLIERGGHLGRTLRYTKRRIEAALMPIQRAGGARHPIHVWVESLPPSYEAALAQIGDLSR